MANNKTIAEMVTELLEADKKKITGNILAIWGGKFPADSLAEFLQHPGWSGLEYRIWEQVDAIFFDEEYTMPENLNYLEYGRLFGTVGDLLLRRDSGVIHWRFVGEPDVNMPDNFPAKSFWMAHPRHEGFFREEGQLLLWGKYKEEEKCWHDDRVAKQMLRYPVAGTPKNEAGAVIQYVNYSEAGKVQFVWYTGVGVYEGE